MRIHSIDLHDIGISENRQRKEFKPEEITKLADSISQNGLIQPVVVRREGDGFILVAGERRIRALQYVWNFGEKVRCGEEVFGEGEVPCINFGELDPIDAFEMELEENCRRVDLTWQERATASARLFEFRRAQAERNGTDSPTIADIAKEIKGDGGPALDTTRKEILVSKHLADPDVSKAKSADEAFKVLKRKEDAKRNIELGESIGKTFNSSVHTLLHGDCLELMRTMGDESFDVILTDPPYGMDAQNFGDSGGMLAGGSHFYDDSFDTWKSLMAVLAKESFRLAKPAAHLYAFCDVENFMFLKSFMSEHGWKCFRTPLIWINPSAMRAPWPEMGPQRKYQTCLYAVKGDKPCTRIYSDAVTYPSDENLGHPAQKPVALYQDLLRRSVRPGDTVFDPFCGSGTIFPAAHEFKCRAVGIEMDDAAYGLAAKRLSTLV